MSRLTQPASTTSATWTRRSYQSLDASRLTIGGGTAKVKINPDSVQLAYGSGHVDVNGSYVALVYGNSYVKVDSTGIHHVGNVDK